MTIEGGVSIIVLDAYPVAISSLGSRVDNCACFGRVDRGSYWVGDVDSVVEISPAPFES